MIVGGKVTNVYNMFDNRNIIFYLNSDLQVFELKAESTKITQVEKLERQSRGLDLQHRFWPLWEQIYHKFELRDLDKIYLFLGPQSGFTDSRIVFIWLKSWQYFNPSTRSYFVSKTTELDLMKLHKEIINGLLAQSTPNPEDLSYVQEPRIGKNK